MVDKETVVHACKKGKETEKVMGIGREREREKKRKSGGSEKGR